MDAMKNDRVREKEKKRAKNDNSTKNKAQQANDGSLDISSKFSTLSTFSAL